ncbi:hypothetical protein [Neobacillus niacini]
MKKAIVLLFSLSLLFLLTPVQDVNKHTSFDTAVSKPSADPIFPPVG